MLGTHILLNMSADVVGQVVSDASVIQHDKPVGADRGEDHVLSYGKEVKERRVTYILQNLPTVPLRYRLPLP